MSGESVLCRAVRWILLSWSALLVGLSASPGEANLGLLPCANSSGRGTCFCLQEPLNSGLSRWYKIYRDVGSPSRVYSRFLCRSSVVPRESCWNGNVRDGLVAFFAEDVPLIPSLRRELSAKLRLRDTEDTKIVILRDLRHRFFPGQRDSEWKAIKVSFRAEGERLESPVVSVDPSRLFSRTRLSLIYHWTYPVGWFVLPCNSPVLEDFVYNLRMCCRVLGNANGSPLHLHILGFADHSPNRMFNLYVSRARVVGWYLFLRKRFPQEIFLPGERAPEQGGIMVHEWAFGDVFHQEKMESVGHFPGQDNRLNPYSPRMRSFNRRVEIILSQERTPFYLRMLERAFRRHPPRCSSSSPWHPRRQDIAGSGVMHSVYTIRQEMDAPRHHFRPHLNGR